MGLEIGGWKVTGLEVYKEKRRRRGVRRLRVGRFRGFTKRRRE
jgi:hypothetical protein